MPSDTMIALRLAQEGFGSIQAILDTPTDLVLSAYEYSVFLAEYEETMIELNRETK